MNALTIDNRDLEEVCAYQEARIEALTKRIKELEAEIAESRRIGNQEIGLGSMPGRGVYGALDCQEQ